MYSRTANAFALREQELAATLADHASRILTGAGVGVTDDDLSARLTGALRAREVIAQAQGIVMDRDALSAEDAYTTLRRASVRQGRSLASWAAEVGASTQRQTDRGT